MLFLKDFIEKLRQAWWNISIHIIQYNIWTRGSVYLRIFFRNPPISNKNCLWWTCLLTDRDEMSKLYRGPSIAATYQVSVHLAKRFRSSRFVGNLLIRNTNCLCWPCLLTDPKLAIFIEGLP